MKGGDSKVDGHVAVMKLTYMDQLFRKIDVVGKNDQKMVIIIIIAPNCKMSGLYIR